MPLKERGLQHGLRGLGQSRAYSCYPHLKLLFTPTFSDSLILTELPLLEVSLHPRPSSFSSHPLSSSSLSPPFSSHPHLFTSLTLLLLSLPFFFVFLAYVRSTFFQVCLFNINLILLYVNIQRNHIFIVFLIKVHNENAFLQYMSLRYIMQSNFCWVYDKIA